MLEVQFLWCLPRVQPLTNIRPLYLHETVQPHLMLLFSYSRTTSLCCRSPVTPARYTCVPCLRAAKEEGGKEV